MKNVYGFVTVRSESTRLPRKCFLPLGKKSIIETVIARCIDSEIIPIICTTISSADDSLEELSNNLNVLIYRGSIKNKMQRWLKCAELFNLEDFHTIDADDPFFDQNLVKKSMKLRRSKNLDFVKPSIYSANGGASVGYSIKTSYLKSIIKNTDENSDTEMIDNLIEGNQIFSSARIEENQTLNYQIRLTLDYEEDYWLIATIFRILGPNPKREKIVELFKLNPDLHNINFFRNTDWSNRQKEIIASQKKYK
tara:strand:+ start:4082 stop:4837 length:756 start_codon:yes stop_codon:yes gene_type:complete